MTSRREESFDPAQPALIVMYGNTAKKYRPLVRDVILLGRAHGCDIGLDAIGVLPVHCVITRREGVYYIRNCAGHGGTRLNGESIVEGRLHDADALQVGPFSFQVHLPPESLPKPANSANLLPDPQLQHLARSRRRLAQLALAQRRRLRQQQAGGQPATANAHPANLEADLKRRVQQVEQHLAHRKATVEADLQARKEECQRLCQEAERACAERLRQATAAQETASAEAERLEIRARELDHFAQHLHRTEQRLDEQAAGAAHFEEQRAALAEREGALEQRRAEVTRIAAELEATWQTMLMQQSPEQQDLLQENVRLRKLLAERDRQQGETETPPARDGIRLGEQPDELPGVVAVLRGQLEGKDALIAQLRAGLSAQPTPPAAAVAIDSYEAELNQFRLQLEAERRALTEEVRQLQDRNAELDEAVREAELKLSREQAQMARERAQLERMRAEIQAEQERNQREAELRSRLAAARASRNTNSG